MELDNDGRLLKFEAVPPQVDSSGNSARSADWQALFTAAGLDLAQFQTVAPEWVPLVGADSRVAWTGTYPEHPDLPIRVEASAWHGKPVYFQIIWPWVKPARMSAGVVTQGRRAANLGRNLVVILIAITGIVMARQNSLAGRGDHRTALRLGIFGGIVSLTGWLLSAHHVAMESEQSLLGEAIADAVLRAVILLGIYLALEPWVRRHWPQTLITWTRLWSGRVRDPMVGRDLLFSVLFGLAYCAMILAFESLDNQPATDFTIGNLLGGARIGFYVLQHVSQSLVSSLEFFLMMFLLRVLLRKQWIAAIAFVLIWVALQAPGETGGALLVRGGFYLVIFGILVTIMLRNGLFALVVTVFLIDGVNQTLLTNDLGAWYGLSSLVVLLVIGGLTAFGFWTSLGSRKLLDEAALEN